MTTPGAGFPVVGPSGEVLWWVIPEGSSTNLAGSFVVVSGSAAAIHAKYGSVAQGPFSTKAEAQAAAANQPGISGNPGTAIGQGVSSAVSGLNPLSALFQSQIWLRVVEVIAGLVLLGIGVNAMFKGKPLQVVTGAAGIAGKVVP